MGKLNFKNIDENKKYYFNYDTNENVEITKDSNYFCDGKRRFK